MNKKPKITCKQFIFRYFNSRACTFYRKMNFFANNFKEHVFKGTPISDCFLMKMV